MARAILVDKIRHLGPGAADEYGHNGDSALICSASALIMGDKCTVTAMPWRGQGTIDIAGVVTISA